MQAPDDAVRLLLDRGHGPGGGLGGWGWRVQAQPPHQLQKDILLPCLEASSLPSMVGLGSGRGLEWYGFSGSGREVATLVTCEVESNKQASRYELASTRVRRLCSNISSRLSAKLRVIFRKYWQRKLCHCNASSSTAEFCFHCICCVLLLFL